MPYLEPKAKVLALNLALSLASISYTNSCAQRKISLLITNHGIFLKDFKDLDASLLWICFLKWEGFVIVWPGWP